MEYNALNLSTNWSILDDHMGVDSIHSTIDLGTDIIDEAFMQSNTTDLSDAPCAETYRCLCDDGSAQWWCCEGDGIPKDMIAAGSGGGAYIDSVDQTNTIYKIIEISREHECRDFRQEGQLAMHMGQIGVGPYVHTYYIAQEDAKLTGVIVMERFEMSLHTLIQTQRYDAYSIGPVIFQLLQSAANSRVLCIDLKPNNIVVNTNDGFSVRLIDFSNRFCTVIGPESGLSENTLTYIMAIILHFNTLVMYDQFIFPPNLLQDDDAVQTARSVMATPSIVSVMAHYLKSRNRAMSERQLTELVLDFLETVTVDTFNTNFFRN